MTLDERFAKAVGRSPTERERERLLRLGDALELQDNDALWAIVMALELYDSLYRQYPDRLAVETTKAIEGARQAFAAAAKLEAARVQGALVKQVVRSSAELARTRGARAGWASWLAVGAAAVVGFGALCVCAGAVLECGARPWWVRGGAAGWSARAAMVLGAPAGWMILALLVPVAAYAGWAGWARVRRDANTMDAWGGWAVVVASGLGAVVLLLLLAVLLLVRVG